MGEPATGNIPGARSYAASWVDSSGNLWLFGGNGFDGGETVGYLNDLWEFNPFTNEWAWMTGASTIPPVYNSGSAGVYGTLGVAAAGNTPGSRMGATSWTDNSGNLWLFGGWGFDASGNDGSLNDLWEFTPSANEWAWMAGSSTVPQTSDGSGSQPGVYGIRGTPAAGNIPGGRQGGNGWTDSSGNLWLFGGSSINGNNTGYLNDLWEFSPKTGEWTWMCGSDLPGDSGEIQEPCGDPAGSYEISGFVPADRWNAANWTDSTGQFWLFGGINGDGYGRTNDLWVFNPSSQEWAWKGGSLVSPGGVYGTLGTPAPRNIPGVRDSSSVWVDGSNNLWLFGGYGDASDASGNAARPDSARPDLGELNDLWMFSPTGQSFPRAGAPTFSVTAGVYTEAQSVTITDSTSGATIYYTTDGTTPTISSIPYTVPVTVSWTETLKAIATASGYSKSTVTAAAYAINLPPPDFAIADSPAAFTVTAGSSATTTLSVTPANGFNAAVSFACTGLPEGGATCSFSPATVTPSGTTASSTTLTVATSSATALLHRNGNPLFPETAFSIALCCIGWRKRRYWQTLPLLAMCNVGLGLLNGCGGGGSSTTPPPQPVTSTITVTATSGSLQHTSTLTLTVN